MKWWQKAVIYEIYPKSFYDSNGDGIGDIPGIIKKLPYIKDLGVDAIWLTPIYLSPQVDNGYDVADYRKVDPMFGATEDLKNLIKEAHKQGIKVILDMVANHTSDQCVWFKESKNQKIITLVTSIFGKILNQMVVHQIIGLLVLAALHGLMFLKEINIICTIMLLNNLT